MSRGTSSNFVRSHILLHSTFTVYLGLHLAPPVPPQFYHHPGAVFPCIQPSNPNLCSTTTPTSSLSPWFHDTLSVLSKFVHPHIHTSASVPTLQTRKIPHSSSQTHPVHSKINTANPLKNPNHPRFVLSITILIPAGQLNVQVMFNEKITFF